MDPDDNDKKKLNDDVVVFMRKRSETEAPRYTARLKTYVDFQQKRRRAENARLNSLNEKKRSNHSKKNDSDTKYKSYSDNRRSGEVGLHHSRSLSDCGSDGDKEAVEKCGKRRRKKSCGKRRRKKSCGKRRRRKKSCGKRRRRKKSCGKRRRRKKSCGRRRRKRSSSCKKKRKRSCGKKKRKRSCSRRRRKRRC